MGNYISTSILPGKKRKRTESGSSEHDFNAQLRSGQESTPLSEETNNAIPQREVAGHVSLSQLNTILSRMNQPPGDVLLPRNRATAQEASSSSHLNIRNSDIDSLMFNRSRINRAK